jgi:hypothetical protein
VTIPRPRSVILAGALLTASGLAVAASAPIVGTDKIERIQEQQHAGGFVLVAGWLILAIGIHRFGRESES